MNMEGIIYLTLDQAIVIHKRQSNTAVAAHTSISTWGVWRVSFKTFRMMTTIRLLKKS